MDERFIIVPYQYLEESTLLRLLGEFVSRQGADSTDTLTGEREWAAQLIPELKQGQLLIVHDLNSETATVVTREQWHALKLAADSPQTS